MVLCVKNVTIAKVPILQCLSAEYHNFSIAYRSNKRVSASSYLTKLHTLKFIPNFRCTVCCIIMSIKIFYSKDWFKDLNNSFLLDFEAIECINIISLDTAAMIKASYAKLGWKVVYRLPRIISQTEHINLLTLNSLIIDITLATHNKNELVFEAYDAEIMLTCFLKWLFLHILNISSIEFSKMIQFDSPILLL